MDDNQEIIRTGNEIMSIRNIIASPNSPSILSTNRDDDTHTNILQECGDQDDQSDNESIPDGVFNSTATGDLWKTGSDGSFRMPHPYDITSQQSLPAHLSQQRQQIHNPRHYHSTQEPDHASSIPPRIHNHMLPAKQQQSPPPPLPQQQRYFNIHNSNSTNNYALSQNSSQPTTTFSASTQFARPPSIVSSSSSSSFSYNNNNNNLAQNSPTIGINVASVPQGSRTLKLIIRQQPERVRICGHGEKDRRPIDPPPIVQLQIFDWEGRLLKDNIPDLHFFAVHASLIPVQPMMAHSVYRSAGRHRSGISGAGDGMQMPLAGSLVASVNVLNDLDMRPGFFFIWTDLSVRAEGTYRLQFTLFNLAWASSSSSSVSNKSSNNVNIVVNDGRETAASKQSEEVIMKIISEPFQAYTAKRFPGMLESSDLMRHFSKQGIKVTVRSHNESETVNTDSIILGDHETRDYSAYT